MKEKVAVVGAGLVGTLWALVLGKKGYQVEVFERRPDMRSKGYAGGRSINLALSHRGWKALEMAEVSSLIHERAIPMYGRMIHNIDGTTTYQPYGRKDQAIYSVSRGGLNLALLEAAAEIKNITFNFQSACTGIDLQTCALQVADANGQIEDKEFDLIFGTDGAFSPVRNSLQHSPRFNYTQHYLEHGYKELTIPAGENGSFLLEKNALHIWPRRHFMLIALPNADGSFTCTLFLPFEGNESFEKLTDASHVEQFFKTYFSDAVPLMPGYVNDFFENPTSTLVTLSCAPWQYKQKVMLLGDAAHAIVPFFGQGMNAGFEDCTILHEFLEQQNGDWASTFEKFNSERIKDGNAIAELAMRNFIEMRDLVADPEFLLKKKIAAHFHEQYPDAFLPVYSMVSFSHIPYHIALQEYDAQDQMLSKMAAIPDILDKLNDDSIRKQFMDWLQTRPVDFRELQSAV